MKSTQLLKVCIAIVFAVCTQNAKAGKGAYLQFFNLTPYTVNLSLNSSSVSCMNVVPAGLNTSLAPYNSSWPASGTQYIESDDGCLLSTSYIGFNIASGSNTASIIFSEDYSSYEVSSTTSNGLMVNAIITNPGPQYSLVVYIMLPNNRWMTLDPNIQNATLKQISIPGAHDAGMSAISKCTQFANTSVTQTQTLSIYDMLNMGVRYFDIRPVIYTDGQMYLGHFQYIGTVTILPSMAPMGHIASGPAPQPVTMDLQNQGCVSYTMDAVLADIQKFMTGPGNKEVVLLNVGHFMDLQNNNGKNSGFTSADYTTLINKIQTALGNNYLLVNNTNYLNTPISQLTQGSPKVIVAFDNYNTYNGSNGIYSSGNMNLYDNYSDTNDFDTMSTGQLKQLAQDTSGSSYFLLSWTLTQSTAQVIGCNGIVQGFAGGLLNLNSCTSILNLAAVAYSNLFMIPGSCKSLQKYPNIVETDAINSNQITVTTLLNNQNPAVNK